MCGVFGFVGHQPDREYLESVAEQASRRGPHSYGFAWLAGAEADDSIQTHRALGLLGAHLKTMKLARDARVLIGHARLATSSHEDDLASTQPIVCGSVALSHNGVVRDHAGQAAAHRVALRTTCDSEVIAAIAAKHRRASPGHALAQALELVPRPTPFAVLAVIGGRLVVARRGLPLYAAEGPGGAYFGSRPWSGECLAVPPETIRVIVPNQAALEPRRRQRPGARRHG